MRTQVGPIGKNGEQAPYPSIIKLGFIAGKRTEMAAKACQTVDAHKHIKQMPLWDLFVQGFLQLDESGGLRLGLQFLERGLTLLINSQVMIRWPGSIHFCCYLCQPCAQVLNEAFGCCRDVQLLTIGCDFQFALLPRKKLVSVISKLFRTTHTEITRLEFGGDVGKDAGFQVLSEVTALALMLDADRAEPLLTGKREIQGNVQVGLAALLVGNNELHGIDERLTRASA